MMTFEKTQTYLENYIMNNHYFDNLTSSQETKHSIELHAAVYEMDMQMSTSWTREEYLNWVKNWKMLYAKLSLDSRIAKKHRKETLFGKSVSAANTKFVRDNSKYAFRLMDIRMRGKEFAETAYQKEHANDILEVA